MSDMKRPDDFDFAMTFLGDPERSSLMVYITRLEAVAAECEKVALRLRKVPFDGSGDGMACVAIAELQDMAKVLLSSIQ